MGFWENLGDSVLSIGGPITKIGLGIWVLIGIGVMVAIMIMVIIK